MLLDALFGLSLKVCPLAIDGLVLEVLPAGIEVSIRVLAKEDEYAGYLHLGLLHGGNHGQLALGDLDDLLNETGTNLVLQLGNPVQLISHGKLNRPIGL
jgi:hypothetical protein